MMKNKFKYLLFLIPFLLVLIFYKKPIKKTQETQTLKEKASSKEEIGENKQEKEVKEFKRKIINLSPPSKKITVFTNKKDERWKDLLEVNLLKFQEPTTKVKIVHLEGIIFSQYGKARLAEKVLVSYTNQDGLVSSFNAYVDSQTGQIIGLPWNKTVIENKVWPRIPATGHIKQIKKIKKDKPEEK